MACADVEPVDSCAPKLYAKTPHLARFELANFRALKELVRDHKIPCEWQDVKNCHAFMTESMYWPAVKEVERLWAQDPETGSFVRYENDRQQLKSLRLGDEVVGAVIQANAASLWPYKLVAWILEQLLETRSAGLSSTKGSFNLQTNTPVTNLQRLDDDLWCLHTPRGMLVTKHILLTTNAYTSSLLPEFSDLIVPVRGQMSALIPPLSLNEERPLAGFNSYGFVGNGTQSSQKDEYLIQRPWDPVAPRGGELMFGGGRRFAKHQGVNISDDSEIDIPTKGYLRRALNDVLDLGNNNKALAANYEWTGIMGFSRDGAPWVGPVPKKLGGGPGLWVCAGFTSHGMPNASLSARAAIREMMGWSVDEVDLPLEFRITAQRIESARKLLEVKEALAIGVCHEVI